MTESETQKIIEGIKAVVFDTLRDAVDESSAERARIHLLGRKGGKLTELMRSLKDMPLEKRRVLGPLANGLKEPVEDYIAAAKRGDVAGQGRA
ncbi:MAG: hypothetical protein HYR52_06010, partial [Candidatus Tectomicrobia bacterium]|nr:hypothetical protein [Candidatus Tectomicrobia bacterium]